MNILIIGGSSGIGISLAKYLQLNNFNIILTYNHHTLTLDNIETIKLDITNETEIEEVIKYVINKYRHIDIIINLVAVNMDNSFLDKTKEEFMQVLEVNLVGTFLVNKIYSKYINNGVIINMASTDGIDTCSSYSIDYGASKAGIINMTKTIALATENKVYCLCPNWIDSNSTNKMNKEYLNSELKRIGQNRLITKGELNESIYRVIKMNEKSGSVFRIDIVGDKLWIGKIS